MGAVNIDNTGSGASVTLSSDGTDLLLNGSPIGGGGGGASPITISNKTGAYTVVAGDLGTIINCTSGTFTVALDAAATLGSGFNCWIWNTSTTSTNAITIDPNGAETIDGRTTLILRRGEGTQIVCDGTNWQTGDKKTMRGYAENILATTTRTQAAGDNSIALGAAASSSGQYSTALGYFVTAAAQYSTAIGSGSNGQAAYALTGAGSIAIGAGRASGVDSFAAAVQDVNYGASSGSAVAIGFRAQATNSYSYACGNNAFSSGINSVAIGANASATNTSSLAIGRQPTASATGSLAIGYITTASSSYSSAVGANSATQGSQAVTGSGAMALGGSYASGTDSFAAAVANNTSTYGAKGANSVAFGKLARATAIESVAIGTTALASGFYGIAIGTSAPTASGYQSIALGAGTQSSGYRSVVVGTDSVANQQHAFALGRAAASVSDGKLSYASGNFNITGDAQMGRYVLRVGTSDNSPAFFTTDGSGIQGLYNQILLADYSAYTFSGLVVAKEMGMFGMQTCAWKIEGLIVRDGGAGTTYLAAQSVTTIYNPYGWGVLLAADSGNGALEITALGAVSTEIRWVATVETSEVINP